MQTCQIWCEVCQQWHKIAGWNDVAQHENWGCALELKSATNDPLKIAMREKLAEQK